MAQFDLQGTTTTQTNSVVKDFSVTSQHIDEADGNQENFYDNEGYTDNLSYFKTIPEYNSSTKALARWAFMRGYTTDKKTESRLESIKGWGEEGFLDIIRSAFISAKFHGDSYTEVIRNKKGTLLNLKRLNPRNMRTVTNKKGIIIRYEEIDKAGAKARRTYHPNRILHLVNDRVDNENHGTPSYAAAKWAIDARNEAMSDKRRVHHRSTIRVIEVEADNTTDTNKLRAEYAEAIKNGEVLLVPKGTTGFPNAPITFLDTQQWIQYLEGFIYQALGVPQAIANTKDFTEAASKVGYMTFEPVYVEEQVKMESDLWNQLAIKIKFMRPPSLAGTMQEDEAKNTGQVSIQPNETQVGVNRNE